MSNLPACRVTAHQTCFYHCGTDLAGPFYVTVKRSREKQWIVAFSCLSSRATHLEVASSLDTGGYLQALIRFISNRSVLPKIIYSDNGTNLKSADKEIQAMYANLDKIKIAESMALRKIDWKYSPPAASHQNGATEIVFKQVRKCLQSMVGEAKMKDEAFRTVIAEVACILNSRPLCALSTEVSDLKVLTPNMLLGGSVNAFLPPNEFDTADHLRNSWKHAQGVVNAFWKRWYKEYLHTLTLRQKWFAVKRNLLVNDVLQH